MAAAHDTHGLFARREEYGTQADARELGAFFREYDAAIGFRSTFSAMLAAASGVAIGSGPPASWDPYAEIIDRISRGTKVYRTLKRMDAAGQSAHVCVLYRLHGPRNGTTERAEFGDLAPLAAFTDAAEEARVELVLRESTRREERVCTLVARSRKEQIAELAEMFWTEVGVIHRAEASLLRLDQDEDDRPGTLRELRTRLAKVQEALLAEAEPGPSRKARRAAQLEGQIARAEERDRRAPARATELERRIEAGWRLLEQILEGVAYDGTLRARLGAIAGTDREITVEDALRAKLDPPKRRQGDREAYAAWSAARSVFIAEVKAQAEAMRKAAHAAYRKAKGAAA